MEDAVSVKRKSSDSEQVSLLGLQHATESVHQLVLTCFILEAETLK